MDGGAATQYSGHLIDGIGFGTGDKPAPSARQLVKHLKVEKTAIKQHQAIGHPLIQDRQPEALVVGLLIRLVAELNGQACDHIQYRRYPPSPWVAGGGFMPARVPHP